MFGAILKATNSSFQKGMPICCSIHVKKVMKLLAFIFEQPSYGQLNEAFAYTGIIFLRLSVCTNISVGRIPFLYPATL